MPIRVPINAPNNTSVGKCTNRYRREKQISNENSITGIPLFLWNINMLTAPPNAQAEWVDGHE